MNRKALKKKLFTMNYPTERKKKVEISKQKL